MDLHPVETLRLRLDFVTEEGPMRPIRQWIQGRAFFPGGSGLFIATSANPLPPMPLRPIMFVGHNFDSEASYAQSLASGEESISTGTWLQLLRLLRDAEIDPACCFFTNAIMGLMPGVENTGESPGFRNHAFRSLCAEYLRFQVATVQPVAVVTMGLEALQVFQEAFPSGNSGLSQYNWSTIDAHQRQFSPKITLGDQSFSFAALVHPSYRNSNVHRRRFEGKSGNAAEIELLRRVSMREC